MRAAFLFTVVCSLFLGPAVAPLSAQVAEDNLVYNADFSEVSSVGDPLGWLRGGWGENTREYDFWNNNALGVTISSENYVDDYVNGDVKWYFQDIAIEGEKNFFVAYDSNTNVIGAEVVARYTLPDGSYVYEQVGEVPTEVTQFDPWLRGAHEFTVPETAQSFTLFFLVRGDMQCHNYCGLGNRLYIRDVFVTTVTEEVTEETETENSEDTTEEVPEETNSSNLVQNGSFEFGDATPDHWYLAGWGDNDRTHVYAVDGYDGDRAARVEVGDYVNGDAKWGFADITTTGGTYTYSDYYRSDIPSELGLYYQTATGPQYQFITWLPAASDWTKVERAFDVPSNATSFSVYHYVYADGFLEIDNVTVVEGETAIEEESTTEEEAEETVEETATTTDPYTPPAEWEDVTLTVQVRSFDHASTKLTPVPLTGEYSIGRLEMVAEESDVVILSKVAVRIETPGAYPEDVIADLTFIDFPLANDRPFGVLVPERSSFGSGYYEFTLPQAIYVTEGTPEAFTIGAIFTEDFAHDQDVQLTISDDEMAEWKSISAAYNTLVINTEADYVGPIYTLQQVNPPANSGPELFALVDALLTQIVEMDVDLTPDMQITRLTLQIEAQELRDRDTVSAEELQQFISRLLAFIAALEANQDSVDTPSVCPYTWTRDLSIGVEGADVLKLQQFLNENTDTRVAVSGPGSAGNETDTYDAATAAAVAKFQVFYRAEILTPQGLVNPTGEFGPTERARANTLCLPATDDMMDDELTGEASLDLFALFPAYDYGRDIEIGKDDAVIGQAQVRFDDGDAEISRIDIALGSAAGVMPADVFDTVSVWVDGDKFGEVAVDDKDFYRLANLGVIARANEIVDVVIAASVKKDIPAAAISDWQLHVESLRFFDADGVATTEDSFDEIGQDGQVSFAIVEEAKPAITIRTSSNDPDASTLRVDAFDQSDEYVIGVFEIESEADDLSFETISVRIDTPDGNTIDIIDEVELVIDGTPFRVTSAGGTAGYAMYNFDIDGDIWLDENEEVDVEVVAIFEEAQDYALPQQIIVSLDENALQGWEVEGVEDFLQVENINGGYVGEIHTLALSIAF